MSSNLRNASRAAILGALLLTSVNSYAISPGDAAPEIALPSSSGKTIQLADYRGKTIYLDFWASWCGPCGKSLPWMESIQKKYGNSGLQIIAVNVDQNKGDALPLLEKVKPSFVVAFDSEGKTPERYEIGTMPTSILINKDGTVHSVHNGFREEEEEKLEKEIVSALSRR